MTKETISKSTAREIVKDIRGRIGFSDYFDNMDLSVQWEIIDSWEAIIIGALDEYMGEVNNERRFG